MGRIWLGLLMGLGAWDFPCVWPQYINSFVVVNTRMLTTEKKLFYIPNMQTVADLLTKWPTNSDFARDVGLDARHISMMKMRNSIHPRHWDAIIKAARKRGITGVSIDTLANVVLQRLKESA